MKTTPSKRLFLAGMLTVTTLTFTQAATLHYGFDSATVDGQTVLNTANILATNVTSPGYSFDASVKSEGSASFRMTGTTSSNFGYFSVPVNVGGLSANGTTQDFSALDTNISFQLRNDTIGQTGVSFRVRLYKVGASVGDYVADYYTSAYGGNTGGSFQTISLGVLINPTTLGPGWVGFGAGYSAADLDEIAVIRLQPSWASGTSGLSMDYHLDNLILTGSGISVIPEPSASALLLGGVLMLSTLSRISARKRVA